MMAGFIMGAVVLALGVIIGAAMVANAKKKD